MISKDVFLKYYSVLSEEFGEGLSDARMLMHYEILSNEMDDQTFVKSVKNILSSRKFNKMPKIAEILEYAKPDTQSIAILAWGDVERAMIKAGAYTSITFEDPVMNSVIESLGGWINMCKMETDEMKWVKKDIEKLYNTFSKRSEHPHHLVGLAEQANGSAKEIALVKASYVPPKVDIVPALNPGRNVAAMIGSLSDEKRIAIENM